MIDHNIRISALRKPKRFGFLRNALRRFRLFLQFRRRGFTLKAAWFCAGNRSFSDGA